MSGKKVGANTGGFRASLERNVFVFAAGIVITTAGITFEVLRNLYGTQIQNIQTTNQVTVKGLEGQLASINRRAAGGDFLNVEKMIIPDSRRAEIAPSAQFFGKDMFYAMTPDRWSYSELRDTDLWNTIYGATGTRPDNQVTGLSPMHVWRRGPFVTVSGNDYIHNIAPLITVQRFPAKDLLAHLGIEDPVSPPKELNVESRNVLKSLRSASIFHGDAVGALLTQNLSYVFEQLRFASGATVNLVTINKVSNVLYCQILITLTNGSLQGIHFDKYYLSVESIVLSAGDSVYVVFDVLPSNDPAPRGPVAAELTEWLNSFSVISRGF